MKTARLVLLLALFYFLSFCVLTFPLITVFSSHFFTDYGDGLQNVWNLWWTRKAVVELHQLPWFTQLLHFPQGTSLLAHTLAPFNGFLGILFSPFLSLVQIHNVMVILGFTLAGVGGYFLCFEITRSRIAALFAGFVFTFCNFHFAHAQGHLQLVSVGSGFRSSYSLS